MRGRGEILEGGKRVERTAERACRESVFGTLAFHMQWDVLLCPPTVQI